MKNAKNSKSIVPSLIGLSAILLLWELIGHIIGSRSKFGYIILPTIERVILSIPKLSAFWGGGLGGQLGKPGQLIPAIIVIIKHSGITLLRVAGGCTIGILLGIGIGILSTWSDRFKLVISLPVDIIRQIPLLLLIPLFLLWFGGNEIGIYLYVAFGVFVIIFVNTINAIKNVPIVQKQFALTLGANKRQLYKTIIIPAIFPEVAGGIRVALALSWAIALGGEYIGAQSGLGRIMILSEAFQFTDRMIFVLILFMLFSIALNGVFGKIFDKITQWKPREI